MNNLRLILLRHVHRIMLVALACALLGLLTPLDTFAECPTPPPASLLGPGEVGLFFDPAGTVTCGVVYFGEVAPLYLVARVPEGGIASYAFSELLTFYAVNVQSSQLPSGAPFEVHEMVDICDTAERIDPESCPTAEGELLVLAVYNVMFIVTSGTVCIQTACPTFEGLYPANPAYSRCDTGSWGELTGGGMMCIGLGQAPVSVDPSSWGAIKSLYSGD